MPAAKPDWLPAHAAINMPHRVADGEQLTLPVPLCGLHYMCSCRSNISHFEGSTSCSTSLNSVAPGPANMFGCNCCAAPTAGQ